MNVLVIDNIDSFVYNLVQYVGEQGAEPVVFQNTVDYGKIKEAVSKQGISGIIISPGPKTPNEAGISEKIIEDYGPEIPLLGVCLGHQCIGHVYGGRIRSAKTLKHGKTSLIEHDGEGLFAGLVSPLEATRYHSLVVDDVSLPDCLQVSAKAADDGEIMGLRHRDYPIHGLQFHPESILTGDGKKIIANFLKLCERR